MINSINDTGRLEIRPLDPLDPREQLAVAMLTSGETREAAMRATGLSFGAVQAAWLRRRSRSPLADRIARFFGEWPLSR